MGNCFSGQKESSSSTNNKSKNNNKRLEETKKEPATTAATTSTSTSTTAAATTTTKASEQPAIVEEPTKKPEATKPAEPIKTTDVVVEEKKAVAEPPKATTTTPSVAAASNFDEATNSFVLKPAVIAKFIIGPKGSTIKQLQEETSSKINVKDSDDDSKHITIEQSANPKACYERIMAELKKYGWEFDAKENQFVEHDTDAMKMFKELEKKISEESKLMSDCFERAKKAYESGDGALSKQLSEEGKQHQELMKKYQQESANTMFEHLNKDKGDLEIDLHGQYVDNAMDFLKKRIEKLRGEKQPKLTIIYGAGNHSDEKGPKIKPAVLEYLKNEGITFEEINHGSISANI